MVCFFFIEPGINQEIGRSENRIPRKGYNKMLLLLSRRLFKICESIFFQSDLPAGKLCTTLPIVPKSRDLWSTFGVWHKHIQSYSSQWIIILWTELPKYCLKNRLKMFNFWFFFCSQMFIRWPLVVASFTYTTTIICRVGFDEIDTYISNCPFSKVHL